MAPVLHPSPNMFASTVSQGKRRKSNHSFLFPGDLPASHPFFYFTFRFDLHT